MSSSELVKQTEFSDWFAERTDHVLTRNQIAKLEIVNDEICRFFGRTDISFLDVGCGTGTLSQWFAQTFPGAQTYGIDISPGMLKHAAVITEGKTYFGMSTAEDMCFMSDRFDVVFEVNTLHHIPARTEAVIEMARVAKRPGMVISVETNALNPVEVYRACTNWSIEWRTLYNIKWRQNQLFRLAGLQNVHTINSTFIPAEINNGTLARVDEMLRTTPAVRELSGVIITIGYKL